MTQKKYLREAIKVGDKELSVETGKVAKQADGSVVVRYGDTMVLVTAVSARTPREGLDFFPLTVEYRESSYSAGRIRFRYVRILRRTHHAVLAQMRPGHGVSRRRWFARKVRAV